MKLFMPDNRGVTAIFLMAKYSILNAKSTELYEYTVKLQNELESLRQRLKALGISWEGEAHDSFNTRLEMDYIFMNCVINNLRRMCVELKEGITIYQEMEAGVEALAGGLLYAENGD